MTILRRVLMTFIVLISLPSLAKDKNFRKVQEVDFSEMSLKGTIRNPDGLFLLQKKGMKFLPLYDLQKDMDKKIRNSEVLL